MDFSALTRRDFTRCNPLTNNPVELFGITRAALHGENRNGTRISGSVSSLEIR